MKLERTADVTRQKKRHPAESQADGRQCRKADGQTNTTVTQTDQSPADVSRRHEVLTKQAKRPLQHTASQPVSRRVNYKTIQNSFARDAQRGPAGSRCLENQGKKPRTADQPERPRFVPVATS